jgi:predicted N-acyltransferase
MYAKAHSYGEYVFDHGWAQAYERAGGRYYPKLQVAVPFTPVPGPRLLVRPDAPAGTREALVAALAEIARRRRVSSLHVTFCSDEDNDAFAEAGWLIRQGFQFHWDNAGYRSFDDFLGCLSHSRRKAIRRERRAVAEQGIALEVVSGADLTRRHWDTFFDFYIATSERKWGDPYLTREFFDVLGTTMSERVALVLASREGQWIGGALNLIGAEALYGRNWGCRGDYPFLHFEACYYQAIDFAIARGLARVEAGAQGEHKLGRGYLPRATWSAHFILDANFRAAVEDFLGRETHAIRHEMRALMADSPFKQATP